MSSGGQAQQEYCLTRYSVMGARPGRLGRVGSIPTTANVRDVHRGGINSYTGVCTVMSIVRDNLWVGYGLGRCPTLYSYMFWEASPAGQCLHGRLAHLVEYMPCTHGVGRSKLPSSNGYIAIRDIS